MADNSIAPAESSAAPPLLDPPSKSSEDSAISLPLPESDDKPTRLDTTLLRGSPVQSPTEPASTTTSTDATAIPDTGPMPTKRPEPPSRTPSPEPQSPSKIVADTDLATRSTKRSKHDRNDRARHGPKTVEIVADDDEHEIARKEALKSLTDIEHEFAKFREKMYQEKMAETEAEVAAVENGTHPLLVSQMVDIEQRKQDRLAAAGARLRQEEISFQRQFEAAVAQAHTDFICRRGEERRRLLNEMDSKRWRMHDERRRMEYAESASASGSLPDRATCMKRRKTLKAEIIEWKAVLASGGFPAATISGLTKNEINEDLELIGILQPRANGAGGRAKKQVTTKSSSEAISAASSSAAASSGAQRGGGLSHSSTARNLDPQQQQQLSPSLPPSSSHHLQPPPSQPSAVWIEGDVFHCDGCIYRRNDKAFLVDHGSKISVKIVTFNKSDLTVQRTNGSKTKIPFEQLEDGRMQLQPKGQG